jgi:ATP-dependent Clp protease ATP-binding subunit ClpC
VTVGALGRKVGIVFERFDDSVRLAFLGATEQARSLRHHYLGTEHLLLGLLSKPSGRPARALSSLGVTHDDVRRRLVEIIGLGPPGQQALVDEGHLPFTPRVTWILQRAEADRERLGAARIDVLLLLALVRERDGVGAQVLLSLGAGIDDIERAVVGLD